MIRLGPAHADSLADAALDHLGTLTWRWSPEAGEGADAIWIGRASATGWV